MSDSKKQHSPQEVMNFQKIMQYAAQAKDVLNLVDLENSSSKTYTVFSKDRLRTAL